MTHIYKITAQLSADPTEVRIPSDQDFLADVKRASVVFNQRSASARNPKSIKHVEMGPRPGTVDIELLSEAPLLTPGKALKILSQHLLSNGYAAFATKNGLLRTTAVEVFADKADGAALPDELFCRNKLARLVLDPEKTSTETVIKLIEVYEKELKSKEEEK